MKRRQFITGLGTAGAAALAGCTGGDDDDGTGAENGTENGNDDPVPAESGADDGTGSETGESEQSGELGNPSEAVESFVLAASRDDREMVTALLHPSHPMHPDNIENEEDQRIEFSTDETAVDDVTTELVTGDLTVDLALDRVENAALFFEEEQLATLFEDEQAALVDATVTEEGGKETRYLSIVLTHEGDWQILWQGPDASAPESVPEFDRRVVDGVTFDTETHRGRVQFVDSPVADQVTVESTNADAHTSTDTVPSTDYLEVGLDPDGDELLVCATVDGESAAVHREQYPPGERFVDDIAFEIDPEDDSREAIARVEFNQVESDGEVTVRSRRHEGRSSAEPARNLNYLVVGIDPSGDEVTVSLTDGGETEQLHRERYHG